MNKVQSEYGGCDVLINNAGVYHYRESITPAERDEMLDANFFGTVKVSSLCCRCDPNKYFPSSQLRDPTASVPRTKCQHSAFGYAKPNHAIVEYLHTSLQYAAPPQPSWHITETADSNRCVNRSYLSCEMVVASSMSRHKVVSCITSLWTCVNAFCKRT